MIVLRLLTIFIFTVLLSGCDDIKAIKEDVRALKADVELYKGLLLATATPEQCPHPGAGEHATMICHYTLQIKGPYEPPKRIKGSSDPNKYKGLFLAAVPQEVVKQAKTDCDNLKKKPEYGGMVCPDHTMYPYREYVIYVEGDVKKDEIWHMVSDPISNHLIAMEKKS